MKRQPVDVRQLFSAQPHTLVRNSAFTSDRVLNVDYIP